MGEAIELAKRAVNGALCRVGWHRPSVMVLYRRFKRGGYEIKRCECGAAQWARDAAAPRWWSLG